MYTDEQLTRIKTWVELLRSGEFQQTKRRLREGTDHTNYRHCCLGVVCELYLVEVGGFFNEVNEFVEDFQTLPARADTGWKFIPVAHSANLGDGSRQWIGLDGMKCAALAMMNDRGWTFNQIADFVTDMLQPEKYDGDWHDEFKVWEAKLNIGPHFA